MSLETWVSLGGLLAVALTVLSAVAVGQRGLRAEIADLRSEVSTFRANLTELATTNHDHARTATEHLRTSLTELATTNHDKAMAAIERLRTETREDFTEVRSEHAEIRASIGMLTDRLFEETRRDRSPNR